MAFLTDIILPIIAILPLVVISIFKDLPIGNMAHFGGLLVGLSYAYYLKTKFCRLLVSTILHSWSGSLRPSQSSQLFSTLASGYACLGV